MRSTSWFQVLATTFLVHVFAAQTSLSLSSTKLQPVLVSEEFEDWNLDTTPDPNATDHLVFETVHSLLQRWPNTRMRNGHAIVPGTIPKGTVFYHGTNRSVLPTGPDWFSTDPEHAYIFCGFDPKQECWQFTVATTRPLHIVYFDGSSAAKLPDGSLDTQDLLLWGEPRGGATAEDRVRIKDICEWGKDYGVDGFVRLQMDFELMLCDPTSGFSVVSSLNLVNRLLGWPERPILFEIAGLEIMYAGSWHNRFPGETRVKLDLAGLITFYDTQLAPSLVPIRVGQERWDHRVQNISSRDLAAVRKRLGEVLTRPDGHSSGIDWKTLIQVIVDRFAERLELVRHLLNTTMADSDGVLVLDRVNKTQTQLRVMLTPYLLISAVSAEKSDETTLDWAMPVFGLCATTHTDALDAELHSMTVSEKLILQAIRGTTREICRVITKMWVAGVYAGMDSSLATKGYPDMIRVARLRDEWNEELNRLMTWLDWAVWIKCNPACGPEELCYLPTWPIGFPGGDKIERGQDPNNTDDNVTCSESRAPQTGGAQMFKLVDPSPDEWKRPRPKCISRVAPYRF